MLGQVDVTKHLAEGHENLEGTEKQPINHSKEWYGYWGNKCPDCGADAEFEEQTK